VKNGNFLLEISALIFFCATYCQFGWHWSNPKILVCWVAHLWKE
jgi:hypothetical protein